MRERIKAPAAAGDVSAPMNTPKVGKRRLPAKLRSDWDSLLWVFASFALLYYTDFASTLLFSAKVNRLALWSCLGGFSVSTLCCLYAFRKTPHLSSANWQTEAPLVITVATIAALCGLVSLCVTIWPVWGIMSTILLSVLFMGFISAISLFELYRSITTFARRKRSRSHL